MTRQEALDFLEKNLSNKNLRKHCLAVEASMKKMAKHFNQDLESWGLSGLLHDIDYEKTVDNPEQHSKIGAQILQDAGFASEIVSAVLTHNDMHGLEPKSLMAKALYCIDPLTGLITAATLVLPEKKLANLKVESILKRFKEPSFAKGANREIIAKCQTLLDLALDEFIQIVLDAMQEVAQDLEL